MSHGGAGNSAASRSARKPTASAHLKDGMIDLAAGTLGGIANVYAGQVGFFYIMRKYSFSFSHSTQLRSRCKRFRNFIPIGSNVWQKRFDLMEFGDFTRELFQL